MELQVFSVRDFNISIRKYKMLQKVIKTVTKSYKKLQKVVKKLQNIITCYKWVKNASSIAKQTKTNCIWTQVRFLRSKPHAVTPHRLYMYILCGQNRMRSHHIYIYIYIYILCGQNRMRSTPHRHIYIYVHIYIYIYIYLRSKPHAVKTASTPT